MELSGEFFVKADPDEAWRVLTDVERVAPCVPGAELREIDGDEYRGVMRVKVGRSTVEYRGSASVLEIDAKQRRAVLRIDGREARGKGTAAATITAVLAGEGDGTKVSLTADGSVSGKLAQLSPEALSDLCAELVSGFSDSLELLLAPSRKPAKSGKSETAAAEPPAGPSHNGTGARRSRSAAATRPDKKALPAESSEAAAKSGAGAAATAAPSGEGAPAATRVTLATDREPATGDSSVATGSTDALTNDNHEDANADVDAVAEELAAAAGRALVARIAAVVAVAVALALIAAWLRRHQR
jgi:carbon monoxide dehydrogenase subunit G